MEYKFQSSRHCKYNINYHYIWIPKYRRKIFRNSEVINYAKENLYSYEVLYEYKILALEIMPEHIHLHISTTPTHSPSELINKIKGRLGYDLCKVYPYLKNNGSIWTNSYFCASTGHVSSETIIKYINNQLKDV